MICVSWIKKRNPCINQASDFILLPISEKFCFSVVVIIDSGSL